MWGEGGEGGRQKRRGGRETNWTEGEEREREREREREGGREGEGEGVIRKFKFPRLTHQSEKI